MPDNHLRAVLAAHQIQLGGATPVAVVGIEGFYKSLAGADTGKNLIGVYDDAICVVTPATSLTFVGNTDPTRGIEGRAKVQHGAWEMGPVIHHRTRPPAERRLAFGQMVGVTLRRYLADGTLGPELHNQYIGWNLHDGSITTTGSEACQTVVPERWPEFFGEVLTPLGIPLSEVPTVATRIKQGDPLPDHWARARFPYILTS